MRRCISGQEVTALRKREDGRFDVETIVGTRFDAGAVVIAGGVGSFQPRRIGVPGAELFEGKTIHYRVRDAASYHGKKLAIFGGGDSALDWVIDFAGKAAAVTHIHRRPEFRGAPASVAKMRSLVEPGAVRYIEGLADSLIVERRRASRGINVKGSDGAMHAVEADHVFAFFGLHPKLGPIAEWGMELEKKALKVDTEKFQTSIPGIFAVGDINTYPGKKKLILSGFHEAALAAFAIQHHLYPPRSSSCSTRPRARSCRSASAFRTNYLNGVHHESHSYRSPACPLVFAVARRVRRRQGLQGRHRRHRPDEFDKKEIAVAADCTEVEVTLKHTGKLPAQPMGHNWVLTKTADCSGGRERRHVARASPTITSRRATRA